MALRIYSVTIEMLRRLRPIIEKISGKDANLAVSYGAPPRVCR